MSTHATAIFEIRSWDEKPWLEPGDGTKLTRASVTKTYRGDIVGEASSETLMCYHADGSAAFTGFERVTATIGGRRGSFVLQAGGTYRNGTATCECSVVPGSGSGELAGLLGEAHYVATHADYPNVPLTMDYRFDGR
jgi:hypothetical protein